MTFKFGWIRLQNLVANYFIHRFITNQTNNYSYLTKCVGFELYVSTFNCLMNIHEYKHVKFHVFSRGLFNSGGFIFLFTTIYIISLFFIFHIYMQ